MPWGYKTFSMLNSAEHEIYPAHNVGILTFISMINILRKTIEGYLDSVPSLTFNSIKTLLSMHVFHSSRPLQSKWMFYFSHASMF